MQYSQRMKNILVLGGTGFVGAHVCEQLVRAGWTRGGAAAEASRMLDVCGTQRERMLCRRCGIRPEQDVPPRAPFPRSPLPAAASRASTCRPKRSRPPRPPARRPTRSTACACSTRAASSRSQAAALGRRRAPSTCARRSCHGRSAWPGLWTSSGVGWGRARFRGRASLSVGGNDVCCGQTLRCGHPRRFHPSNPDPPPTSSRLFPSEGVPHQVHG